MANPLQAFKSLKPWQQGAVVVGGIVVVGGVLLYERKQKASAAPAAVPAAAATPGVTGNTVTDPATGQVYPADDTDPLTGLTYGTEIAEYGSVEAADEQADQNGAAAAEEGLTPAEYYDETGGAGATSATNEQWISEVEASLSQLGYSGADIQQGLARYFSSSPQVISADGTNLYTMMDTAIGEYGPPPTGTYALINGTSGGSGSSTVTVPDEVGRTDLATAEAAIKAAGLVPLPAGDSAKGNKGKVTAQDPKAGSTVSKGSSVTLTYTADGAAGSPSGDVTVPGDLVGADVEQATQILRSAGLKAHGPAGAKGVEHVVTETTPPQGAKVASGTTVTLKYKTVPESSGGAQPPPVKIAK